VIRLASQQEIGPEALLRQQLFVYRDLWTWWNDPYQAAPPLVPAEQLSLGL
jgi:hypothetical protein